MSNKEFSHKVLSLILENREKGNVSKYLDKLNQFVKDHELPENKKSELLELIEVFFRKEDEHIRQFSQNIDDVLGEKMG